LTLLAIVMACTVTSHADEPIPAWAEEASQAYYEANDGSEAAALAALYSVDAVIFVSPTDPGNLGGSTLKLQGRDEIEKFFGDDFENTRYECEWEITGVIENIWQLFLDRTPALNCKFPVGIEQMCLPIG
jgi:hypothetical protein